MESEGGEKKGRGGEERRGYPLERMKRGNAGTRGRTALLRSAASHHAGGEEEDVVGIAAKDGVSCGAPVPPLSSFRPAMTRSATT